MAPPKNRVWARPWLLMELYCLKLSSPVGVHLDLNFRSPGLKCLYTVHVSMSKYPCTQYSNRHPWSTDMALTWHGHRRDTGIAICEDEWIRHGYCMDALTRDIMSSIDVQPRIRFRKSIYVPFASLCLLGNKKWTTKGRKLNLSAFYLFHLEISIRFIQRAALYWIDYESWSRLHFRT